MKETRKKYSRDFKDIPWEETEVAGRNNIRYKSMTIEEIEAMCRINWWIPIICCIAGVIVAKIISHLVST